MKYLLGYLITAVLLVITYFALIDNQTWAVHLLKFYIWVVFFFLIICCVTAKKFSERLFREGKPVKRYISIWIALPLDVTILCLIVAKGWMFLGTLFLLEILLEYTFIETAKNHYKKLQAEAEAIQPLQ